MKLPKRRTLLPGSRKLCGGRRAAREFTGIAQAEYINGPKSPHWGEEWAERLGATIARE